MDRQQDGLLDYDKTVSVSRQESLMKALEIAQAAINERNPPVHRPAINLGMILLRNLICLVVAAGAYLTMSLLQVPTAYRIVSVVLLVLGLTAVNARRIIINSVLIYQRYAPERIRASCVFEPTCSQYMILAVEKYGPVKGVAKGIKRLLRCHPPNSGIDYP